MTWRANTEGRCSYASDGWCRFVGHDAEHSLGHGWLTFVHEDDRERVARDATRQRATQKRFFMYYRLRHHSGRYALMRVHAVPQFDPVTGEFTGYWGDAVECARAKPDAPATMLVFPPQKQVVIDPCLAPAPLSAEQR